MVDSFTELMAAMVLLAIVTVTISSIRGRLIDSVYAEAEIADLDSQESALDIGFTALLAGCNQPPVDPLVVPTTTTVAADAPPAADCESLTFIPAAVTAADGDADGELLMVLATHTVDNPEGLSRQRQRRDRRLLPVVDRLSDFRRLEDSDVGLCVRWLGDSAVMLPPGRTGEEVCATAAGLLDDEPPDATTEAVEEEPADVGVGT